MDAEERLKDYNLESGRSYRYLRIPDNSGRSKLSYVRDDPMGNIIKFRDFEQALLALDVSQDTLASIYKILAAILLLGDVRFKDSEVDKKAALVDPEIVVKISDLLKVDDKKFSWSLLNYCLVIQGKVEKRRHTPDQVIYWFKLKVTSECCTITIDCRHVTLATFWLKTFTRDWLTSSSTR